MNKLIALFALLCLYAVFAAAQNQPERRVIEVSGSAERLITPDEFTFKITLVERIENKQKITIETQENNMRNELTALGVDVGKDLSVYDMSSTYFRQKKVKDVLGTKDYRLKIRDLNKIAKLQDVADRLNVARLDLIDTDHSEITQLRRQTKIEAMQAAKSKAQYLLSSIGQRLGNAVYVKEVEEEIPKYGIYTSNGVSNTMTVNQSSRSVASSANDDLSFTPIKLRYVIIARFEIE